MGQPRRERRVRGFTKVVAIRPGEERAVPGPYAWLPDPEEPEELPLELLDLASHIKFLTPYRVDVIDGRGGGLRRKLAVLRAQVALIQLHPRTLADALSAARACRHAGMSLILAVGPLARQTPSACHAMPEFDGVCHSPATLGAALTRFHNGDSAQEVLAELAGEAVEERSWLPDRKLLDYGRYRRGRTIWSPVRGRRPWDRAERPLPDLVAEIHECEGIGIKQLRIDEVGAEAHEELLERLEQKRIDVRLQLPLRVGDPVGPVARRSQLVGSWRVRLEGSDAAALEQLEELGDRLYLRWELLTGGEEEEQLLRQLVQRGVRGEARLALQPLAGPSWEGYLAAPSQAFRPPTRVQPPEQGLRLVHEANQRLQRPSRWRRVRARLRRVLPSRRGARTG